MVTTAVAMVIGVIGGSYVANLRRVIGRLGGRYDNLVRLRLVAARMKGRGRKMMTAAQSDWLIPIRRATSNERNRRIGEQAASDWRLLLMLILVLLLVTLEYRRVRRRSGYTVVSDHRSGHRRWFQE